MKGWFVTSGYFQNEAVLYVRDAFRKAFEKQGVEFVHYKSNELNFWLDEKGNICFDEQKPNFVIFWDKDVVLARMMEKAGIKVFNDSNAIEICDDKVKTFLHLSNCSIAMKMMKRLSTIC